MTPGEYGVRVVWPDETSSERRLRVEARNNLVVELARPDATQSSPVAPKSSPAPPTTAAGSVQRTSGWITLGVAALAGATAIPLGVHALNARDTFFARETDQGALDTARTFRTATNVTLGVSVVTGAVALVLLLTAPADKHVSAGSSLALGRF